MITKVLSQKLVLLVIGLAAGSGILIPASYGSFHPVTSSEIQDGTIQSIDIGNGQVKGADIGGGAVTSAKIADGTVAYADVSRNLIAVEHRDDCNCGGTGWDPDGTSVIEAIYDGRITPYSVISVTGSFNSIPILCWTLAASQGYVFVRCDRDIPNGLNINYAIFSNPAYG